MWDLVPQPGIELAPHALGSMGVLASGPPGSSKWYLFQQKATIRMDTAKWHFVFMLLFNFHSKCIHRVKVILVIRILLFSDEK